MSATLVMRPLEAVGTAQNRKVYARHGVTGAMFGVSYANPNKLKKELKTDQALAEQLWATGNHDARALATMIADPAQLTVRTAEAWVAEVYNHVDAAALGGLLARSPAAESCIAKWTKTSSEFISDAECGAFLRTIETRINGAQNRVRYSMNTALIAIGTRGGALEKAAIAAARRIGPVDVDHGETCCKTPDAITYIPKAAAHRRQKAAKTRSKAPAKKKAKATARKTASVARSRVRR